MKNHSFLKYCTSILLIFIAVACTTGNKEQKIVTVTIQPQKYFAEKIQTYDYPSDGLVLMFDVSFLPAVTPRPTIPLRLIWFIWAKVSPISKSGT